ncbi:hypothetical protein [Flavobacterium sp.]|uniref:hypothetical protein n=1 Tax=Flavobacterium sp. TaxID=239 RepID=UPI0038D21C3C
METNKNFKLIDGVFNSKEAKKIIISLINNKINYHNLEDFSNHIRFNNVLSNSQKRISELQNAQKMIEELVDLAEKNQWKLKIESTVEINIQK